MHEFSCASDHYLSYYVSGGGGRQQQCHGRRRGRCQHGPMGAGAVRRDPKILRRVSRILIKEGLHFANLFYIFE